MVPGGGRKGQSDNYNERNGIHVMFLSCQTASPSAASIHVLKQSLP